MTQITYIYHDCFVISTQKVYLIFDFWKDPHCKNNKDIPSFLTEMNREKPIYVFVSHHHKDHYSKLIFEWEALCPNIKYIISKDVARHARHLLSNDNIYKGIKPDMNKIIILDVGEHYHDDLISIDAFGSTDIGNSYYVEITSFSNKKLSFFHAGDLNAWLWCEESTKEEIEEALDSYNSILSSIKAKYTTIDYAMFPVDSRIGSGYATGASLFLKKFDVKHFFPMHFCIYESPEESIRLRKDACNVTLYANPTRGEYICLTTPYASYLDCDQS